MLPEEHSLCHANKSGNISHPLENDLREEIGLIWKTVTTSVCIDVFQLNSF